MPSEKSPFGSEYQTPSEKIPSSQAGNGKIVPEQDAEEYIEIATSKYGLGKPKREVRKAKLIND